MTIRRLLILIPLLLVALIIGLDYYFSTFQLGKKGVPVVMGLPAEADQRFTPYAGPHPTQMQRPEDPFSYPIQLGEVGPIEPLFSGPKQYPFLCETEQSQLGQPLVDNDDQIGIPIYATDSNNSNNSNNSNIDKKLENIVGYSKDCAIPTRAWYYYYRESDREFVLLEEAENGLNEGGGLKNKEGKEGEIGKEINDIAKIEINGKEVDFIVRVEVGVINRYLYAIAALKGEGEERIDKPLPNRWNQRLIYQFRGGVGIGRRQGKLKPVNFLNRRADVLKMGYAVAFSTGTQTKHHYNMWLSEEIVTRIKRQFSALYGEPEFTFGIGGSGGAIQQYLLAQNNPELLDAGIALYSYPDMVTQMIYAYDCELLEYYFDVTADQHPKWDHVSNRVAIEGMNGVEDHSNKFSAYYTLARLVNGVSPVFTSHMTECVNGWRGLVQLTNNPHFIHFPYAFDESVHAKTHWTHWEDLAYFYGHDERGYARQAWDNVGVQYGLEALKTGQITVDEFLDLNAKIGGWKPAHQFQQERYWKIIKETALSEISPWSHHNMTHDSLNFERQAVQTSNSPPEMVAPRTVGDLEAIRAIHQSGHVFLGYAEMPIIDLRHYMEDELDMHHLSASFNARQRMLKRQGHADNQLIWVTRKPHIPVEEALEVLEEWVSRRAADPDNNLLRSRPAQAMDRCYSSDGSVIAEGENVWDGEWNQRAAGACMKAYPSFKTSRLVAGESWLGDTFKCQLQSIEQAIESGLYGEVKMEAYREALRRIFPDGVCDYRLPGVGSEAILSEFSKHSRQQKAK